VQITTAEILGFVGAWFWPFARVAAAIMVAPVFNARVVPKRARLALAVALTLVVAPAMPAAAAPAPFSAPGLLLIAQEMLIGLAMGFALQLTFDALVIAGQTVAMSMGLGFAFLLDPQRGVSVPVLSQVFVMLATLTFLALDGHLALIETLVSSFTSFPVGSSIGRDGAWQLVGFAGTVFAGALQVALPAAVALIVVNLAFGVMSRAAPTLNLFAVGFPVTMALGFVILLWTLPNVQTSFVSLLSAAFTLVHGLVG
jgi:flagellar biosynthetic protein FliR